MPSCHEDKEKQLQAPTARLLNKKKSAGELLGECEAEVK